MRINGDAFVLNSIEARDATAWSERSFMGAEAKCVKGIGKATERCSARLDLLRTRLCPGIPFTWTQHWYTWYTWQELASRSPKRIKSVFHRLVLRTSIFTDVSDSTYPKPCNRVNCGRCAPRSTDPIRFAFA